MKHSTELEHALKNLRQLTGITLDVKADTRRGNSGTHTDTLSL